MKTKRAYISVGSNVQGPRSEKPSHFLPLSRVLNVGVQVSNHCLKKLLGGSKPKPSRLVSTHNRAFVDGSLLHS